MTDELETLRAAVRAWHRSLTTAALYVLSREAKALIELVEPCRAP